MTDEPRAMREIHEIREKLYEEMKGLTIGESGYVLDSTIYDIQRFLK